jgi:O-methyltransferase
MALTIYSKRPDIDSLPGRRRQSFPEITDELFWSLYDRAKPYSLLHIEGFFNLFQSIRYVVANRIPGCMIECGCFYGGASIFMALLARALGDQRPLIVFDTFAGMPAGQADAQLGGKVVVGPRYPSFLDAVQENFREAGAVTNVELVEGDVAETLLVHEPGSISVLRLDTDFYVSTRIELDRLYPQLSQGGVIIVDDYGSYEGSRRATDEFFAQDANPPLLNRISKTIWAGVKP